MHGALVDLPKRRDPAAPHAVAKAVGIPRERVGDGPHPRRDIGKVVVGVLRKQVEQHSNVLHRGCDDVQLGMEVTGLIAIEVKSESLQEHVGGDLLGSAADRLLGGGGHGPAGEIGLLGEPRR